MLQGANKNLLEVLEEYLVSRDQPLAHKTSDGYHYNLKTFIPKIAAKPIADVITPRTAAIKEVKKMKINKISIFTPYSKILNDEVLKYFKSEGFEVTSNSYFDIEADYDIGKVDQNYLYDVLLSLIHI